MCGGVWWGGGSVSICVVPGGIQCRVSLISKDMPAVTPTTGTTGGRQLGPTIQHANMCVNSSQLSNGVVVHYAPVTLVHCVSVGRRQIGRCSSCKRHRRDTDLPV